MVDVLEELEARRGSQSVRSFAREVGDISSTAYTRYMKRESNINTTVRANMINHFAILGDDVMVGVLLLYKTGVCLDNEQLADFGRQFIQVANPNKAFPLVN